MLSTEAQNLAKQIFIIGIGFDEFQVNTLIDLLKTADDNYFNNTSEDVILEDTQYDALKQYANRANPLHPYFTGIGSEVRGGKINLPYKLGSLDQIYEGDYTNWISKHSLTTERLIITDKLDGASVLIVYGVDGVLQIAYSRGDGIQGADITRHVKYIHNVPQRINNGTGAPVAIRAENIIPRSKFNAINTGKHARGGRIYKNPRNMVSGLMNSSKNDPAVYEAIDTVAYEIIGSSLDKQEQLSQLHQWGFDVVHRAFIDVASSQTDQTLSEYLNLRRELSDYELDGIVIDVDQSKLRTALGFDNEGLNPVYAVKFKVADASNLAIATVKHVEWNISKDGYLKPRVCIEPVNLVGVTIQHATGFNAKFISDNEIGPGAKIKITRSGDVIPFITGVVEPAPAGPQMPEELADWSGVDLVVLNVATNATVMFERLADFFASIDAPFLGDGNLMKIFEMGFNTPELIILLTPEDLGVLVGSKVMGKKIYTGLREKLTNIPLYKLMGSHSSFGRGVGIRKMKKLYEAFEGDMSKCTDLQTIVDVDGFDTKTATKVVAGYPIFMEFLRVIEDYITIAPYVPKKEGQLSGKIFVFTGFRDKSLEDAIINAGGSMGSAVSGKTSFLVTAEANSTSGKAIKAQTLGVTVIGQDELREMLK